MKAIWCIIFLHFFYLLKVQFEPCCGTWTETQTWFGTTLQILLTVLLIIDLHLIRLRIKLCLENFLLSIIVLQIVGGGRLFQFWEVQRRDHNTRLLFIVYHAVVRCCSKAFVQFTHKLVLFKGRFRSRLLTLRITLIQILATFVLITHREGYKILFKSRLGMIVILILLGYLMFKRL